MAKRQKKVSIGKLENYVKNEVYLSFFMKNKSVFFAVPVNLQSDGLKIKNSKGHILHLPFDQIEEIWADEKVV